MKSQIRLAFMVLLALASTASTGLAQDPPPAVESGGAPACVQSPFGGDQPDAAFVEALQTAQQSRPAGDPDPIELRAKVFVAKKIITMDPMNPEVGAVASLGGRILALGTEEQVMARVANMPHDVVDDFRDAVIYPGFIEAHAHAQNAGLQWLTIYLGQMEQMNPEGVVDPGPQSVEEIQSRIKGVADTKQSGEWIFGWGYDPTILGQELTVADLDPVTGDKPLFILDASMHQAYLNSAALATVGFDETTDLEGVKKGPDGKPTGRVEELEVLKQVFESFPPITEETVLAAQWSIAKLCNLKGVTTVADMNYGMLPHGYTAAVKTAADPTFPVRLSAYVLIDVVNDPRVQSKGGFDLVKQLQAQNSEKFRIAGVKFVLDGSNQGGTGVFLWPYYYDGRPNGVFNYDPDQLEKDLVALYERDIQPTIHVNADGSLQRALEAVRGALRKNNVPDHRTTLQHVQVANDEQFATMKRLGVSPNFLINHIYYWGDDWVSSMGGPVKGTLVDAAGSAGRHGLRFSLHSDHPVTPIDRLLAMSNATNRTSITGQLIGESERITTYEALRAITVDAAYLLGEENEKGSIVIGKYTDLTVLDRDILEGPSTALRDAKVLGTVVGGEVFPVSAD